MSLRSLPTRHDFHVKASCYMKPCKDIDQTTKSKNDALLNMQRFALSTLTLQTVRRQIMKSTS